MSRFSPPATPAPWRKLAFSNSQASTTTATMADGISATTSFPDSGNWWLYGQACVWAGTANDVARIAIVANGVYCNEFRVTCATTNDFYVETLVGGELSTGEVAKIMYARAAGSGTIYVQHQVLWALRVPDGV